MYSCCLHGVAHILFVIVQKQMGHCFFLIFTDALFPHVEGS